MCLRRAYLFCDLELWPRQGIRKKAHRFASCENSLTRANIKEFTAFAPADIDPDFLFPARMRSNQCGRIAGT
jgi:hypothetical protein